MLRLSSKMYLKRVTLLAANLVSCRKLESALKRTRQRGVHVFEYTVAILVKLQPLQLT